MAFTRGEDRLAAAPSAAAVIARANRICAKAIACKVRAEAPGSTCDDCRLQAEIELKREQALRTRMKRADRLLPGDRVR